MIGYLVAWAVYLLAVIGLLWTYRRGLARFLPAGLQPVVLVLAACVLLTPWPIDSESWVPAPAIIAALFHLMSGFWITALKSLFPVLAVSTIACFCAWWISRRRA